MGTHLALLSHHGVGLASGCGQPNALSIFLLDLEHLLGPSTDACSKSLNLFVRVGRVEDEPDPLCRLGDYREGDRIGDKAVELQVEGQEEVVLCIRPCQDRHDGRPKALCVLVLVPERNAQKLFVVGPLPDRMRGDFVLEQS